MEVAELGQRLDRAARLARHDEERVGEVERALGREHRTRIGRVEHVEPQPALEVAERPAHDLGREARPAHAEQHRIGQPVTAAGLGEGPQLVGALEDLVGLGEPAEAVSDLGPRPTPERLVLAPDAACDVLLRRLAHALGDRGLEVGRHRRLEGLRPARGNRLALALDAGQQLVEGVHEQVHAVAQQLVRHVVDVDAGLCQRAHRALDVGRIGVRRRPLHLELLAGGEERGQRHRVDGVRSHQAVDVHHVGVARVLHPGRRPERALNPRPRVAQVREALAVEDLLEAHVGRARVPKARGAEQLGGRAGGLEALVDLRVDARDEEARNRMHVERLARLTAPLETADVRLRDLLVGAHGEEQRDVDVDALEDRLLDRGDSGRGAGNLDEDVRAAEALPVVARLAKRLLGVARSLGTDLERHEAVASQLVVDRAQDVRPQLHVRHGDLVVDRPRIEAPLGQLADLAVVVRAAEDRLLEDRWIRRDPAQAVLDDQALEDLVEPDARPCLRQRRKPLVDPNRDAHRSALLSVFLVVSRPPVRRPRPTPSGPARRLSAP